jgi:hypothetical protein
MIRKTLRWVGVIVIAIGIAPLATALAQERPPVDEVAVAGAIRHEDAITLRTLLLPLVTTAFGDRIQTREVSFWLMRSYVTDQWSLAHMCLEVRIEDAGSWSDWLPAAAWASAPSGDQPSWTGASIAGWDVAAGTRRFAALKELEPRAVESDVERMRTECYHMNDDSRAAASKGLLKKLTP